MLQSRSRHKLHLRLRQKSRQIFVMSSNTSQFRLRHPPHHLQAFPRFPTILRLPLQLHLPPPYPNL